jgi:hypothetical protein
MMSEEIKHTPAPQDPDAPGVVEIVEGDYDRQEPAAGRIAGFVVAIAITIVAVMIGMTYYWQSVHDEQERINVQTKASEDLRNLRSREDQWLYQYKYSDRAAGKVQLPVARAMELIEKEAAENKLFYSTENQKVKTPEELAAEAAGPQKK